MNPDYAAVLDRRLLTSCVECGKCSSICPMAEMYADYDYGTSPRGMVQQALHGDDVLACQGLWRCTQCEACSKTCPAGVDCCGLVADLRDLSRALGRGGEQGTCPICGAMLPPVKVLDYLKERLPKEQLKYLELCPACRRQAYARENS